jgi:acetyl esterase/lipase
MNRLLASAVVLVAALSLAAQQTTDTAEVDSAFSAFFGARTADDTAKASERILSARVTFDEAARRLRKGRAYPPDAPRGIVQASYRDSQGQEFFYTLDVPSTYDPGRSYGVRIQLHGGVGRISGSAPPREATGGRLAGAEQIYVMPYAWRDAPWWSGKQVQNIRAILEIVKRTYNVDENRVVLSGVSDGGTGAYFFATRDTTPFASFLPLNGFLMVLDNEMSEREGEVFPNNLVNKPLFVVNGGRDPLYPTSLVEPYVNHLKKNGVDIEYLPQPDAAHDTSWWPAVKDKFEAFVASHPRRALPDTLTWETSDVPGRAHWLEIDTLRQTGSTDDSLTDVNRRTVPPVADFGIRASGTRVNRVIGGSNAAQFGLRAGDVVTSVNNQPTGPEIDVAEVLRGFPAGRPLLLTVDRDGAPVRLSGRYAPGVLPGASEQMFLRERPSGRVDLVRSGNRIEARTRGVATFRLLLSPDQFDLAKPITVVVNGRTVVDRIVPADVRTLLKWAARDNDRTMLFGAELAIEVAR